MDDLQNLHAFAHGRLSDWSRRRAYDLEALGWAGVSATQMMREVAQGGEGCTAPGALTVVERHAAERRTTLQTELAVLALNAAQRKLIRLKYLDDVPLGEWAETAGCNPKAVYAASRRAIHAVGVLLHRWSRQDEMGRDTPAALSRFLGRLDPAQTVAKSGPAVRKQHCGGVESLSISASLGGCAFDDEVPRVATRSSRRPVLKLRRAV